MLNGSKISPKLPSLESFHAGLTHYPDLIFAIDFVFRAGEYLREQRTSAKQYTKPNGTRVTDVEIDINNDFIDEATRHSGSQTTVIGEEASTVLQSYNDAWVIDPTDGTSEYLEKTKKLTDYNRHSSIGVAKFADGLLRTAIIYNPFRRELYYADRSLGGAYLNGVKLNLGDNDLNLTQFDPKLAYNYTAFKNSLVDTKKAMGNMMENKRSSYVGSTLYQACLVAKGAIAFSVFPGSSIHDIAPAALVVELARGQVSDTMGCPVDWNAPKGAVYSISPQVHSGVIQGLKRYCGTRTAAARQLT